MPAIGIGRSYSCFMKILIIDDEAAIRAALRETLELNGHQVLAASDGEQGIRLAAQAPDFVLCDICMPGMDGYSVLEAIQRLPQGREVPFIFLTARTDRADYRRGMALGADDYLTKPFTVRELLEAIAARVQRQRPLRERIEQLVASRRREAEADWSHELLTPLNAVIGGLDLIEMDGATVSPAELKDLLKIIRSGAERQWRLSRKLVRYHDLQRPKSDARAAAAGPCRAESALAAAVKRVGHETNRAADIRVTSDAATIGLPEPVLADGLAELIENACNFSRPGQRVTITGTSDRGCYRIEVLDEGEGMAMAERERISDFVQFDRERRGQQGLGLGLAIARLTAEYCGGRFTIADGEGGRGLRVTMELPAT